MTLLQIVVRAENLPLGRLVPVFGHQDSVNQLFPILVRNRPKRMLSVVFYTHNGLAYNIKPDCDKYCRF